jgi:hypothetical protein
MVLGKEEKKFDKLKDLLSDDTKSIINEIWEEYIKSEMFDRKWILTSKLIFKFGKEIFIASLGSLNTSILKEYSDNGRRRCYLTFLGMLLTSEGKQTIDLFIKYLSFIQKNLRDDSGFNKIKSENVYKELGLTNKQQQIFTRFLWASRFTDGGGGGGTSWEFGIPAYMENNLILEDNLREFFFRYVFEYSEEKLPSLLDLRESKYRKKKEKSAFSFIADKKLRNLIEKDWEEINAIFNVNAWKSCVLLCGSILEGILINELKRNQPIANQEYQRLKNRNAPVLDRWDLVDLVEISNRLQLFPKGTIHLNHAIREFRNLVHPGKQLREHIEVTEEQAVIAFNTIKELQKIKNS